MPYELVLVRMLMFVVMEIGGYMENQTHLEMKTERLFLRTITEADVDMLRKLDKNNDEFASDEAVLEWIRWVNEKNAEGRLIVNFYSDLN